MPIEAMTVAIEGNGVGADNDRAPQVEHYFAKSNRWFQANQFRPSSI